MTVIDIHDKQRLRALSSMDWKCRSARLGWRVPRGVGDAASFFERVFGVEPVTFHTNKFATASMPCRSWAHGVRTGEELDLRLGLDGEWCQIMFAFGAGAMPPNASLAKLNALREQLEGEGASVLELSIALDLAMRGRVARRHVETWFDIVGQANGAVFQRHEYQFDFAPHDTAHLVCVLDGQPGADEVEMRIELRGLPDDTNPGWVAKLFSCYEALLSASQLSDIAAMARE